MDRPALVADPAGPVEEASTLSRWGGTYGMEGRPWKWISNSASAGVALLVFLAGFSRGERLFIIFALPPLSHFMTEPDRHR